MFHRFRMLIAIVVLCAFSFGGTASAWEGDGPLLCLSGEGTFRAPRKKKKKKTKKKPGKKKSPPRKKKKSPPKKKQKAKKEEPKKEEKPAPPPPEPYRKQALFLGLFPSSAETPYIEHARTSAMAAFRRASGLGTVFTAEESRTLLKGKQLPAGCKDPDDLACIRKLGEETRSKYLLFGKLEDLDDAYLLSLRLLDAETGALLERVKAQIVKPAESILGERSAATACHLVRNYGCDTKNPPVVAAMAAPMAAPAETTSAGKPSDEPEKMLFSDAEPEPEEKPQPEKKKERKKEEPGESMSGMKIGAWVLTGLAAGALAGAATTTGLMYKYAGDYDSAGDDAARKDAKDKVFLMQKTSIGLWAGTGALAAGAVTLFVLDGLGKGGSGGDDGDAWTVRPGLAPDGTFILQGRF